MSINNAHRIVIVGGGAGGLELATMLGRKLGKSGKANVILVDSNMTHIWKPLLHEVAAGTINSFEDELNYFAHSAKNHFQFQLGRMDGLTRHSKQIHLAALQDAAGQEIAPARELTYDTLIMAVGSTTNDFGTIGAAANCVFLDSRIQADRFQSRLLNMYLQAHAAPANADSALNIVIVGAGATGVELAAELHHASHEFVKYGLNEIPAQNVSISLVEAAPRILPALPERLSQAAHARLEKLGIQVYTGQKVTEITALGLKTATGLEIAASLKVWSAGIKAPDFLAGLDGLETSRSNQLVVKPSLQTSLDDNIFAFGDCASCTLPGSSQPVAPRAQFAHQQASFLVKALNARLAGRPLPALQIRDFGSLIALSRYTVGDIAGVFNIQGRLAWLMYLSLYRMHQLALHGPFKTLVLMGKDLLAKTTGPSLKLH
jgi:NADH dehydrogenase